MSDWRVKENPHWLKKLDVVDENGRGVAYFQREEDAVRCVDAVNEVERLLKMFEIVKRCLRVIVDDAQYTLGTIAALAKEE